MQKRDIILIPTYNERENIRLIVPEIFSILPNIHILVIDDNSPDGTAGEVKMLMQKYPNLMVLERKAKNGLGEAYKDALARVVRDKSIDKIVTMDADGSHGSEYLQGMLDLTNKYELVVGSRYVPGGGIEDWEFWRLALSKYGNIYPRLLTGMGIKDTTAGFVCFTRGLLERLDLDNIGASGYAYQIEFKYNCVRHARAKFAEYPIVFKSRRGGESKISNHIIGEGLKAPFKIFLQRIFSTLKH